MGHYFAYQVYYDVAADDDEKQEIRGYVERITDHILDHGLYYVGPPGKPTTWGVWAPEGLNHDLRRIGDRGLNSLEILSHLKVAEHIVGKPRYTAKLRELIEKHGYAINTVHAEAGLAVAIRQSQRRRAGVPVVLPAVDPTSAILICARSIWPASAGRC